MSARRRDLDEALVEDLVDAGSREHYADAALYDYEYRRRRADVTFYRELASRRKPKRILELGAGSGRVTIPLARDGHEIVAIDRSRSMIAKLAGRVASLPAAAAKRVTVLPGELCTFSAPGKFDLVIAAFNVVEHLYTRGEVAACLARVAEHLAPGGAFVFDVQLPDLAWLVRDPTTKRPTFYSTNHDYDPISQIVVIRLYYDPVDGKGPSRIVKLTQRKFFPAELEALVAGAGYRVTARYGDFFWAPLDGTAESQVLVCERPVSPSRSRRSSTRKSRFPSRI